MARILYIDDQIAAQKLVESLLKTAGHQVTLANDGHDGIEKMRSVVFDLLITDAVMPGGVSGWDVVKTIRKQFSPDKLPIILLTGRSERRDVERAIEVGVTDYVLKPVEPKSFVAKVDAALAAQAQRALGAQNDIPISEVAHLRIVLNVTGISERGITLRSAQALRLGGDVDLGSEFFQKIGLSIVPHLSVAACDAMPGNQFRIEAKFTDLDAPALAALRLWVTFNRTRKLG